MIIHINRKTSMFKQYSTQYTSILIKYVFNMILSTRRTQYKNSVVLNSGVKEVLLMNDIKSFLLYR